MAEELSQPEKLKIIQLNNPNEILDIVLLQLSNKTEREPISMDEIHWNSGLLNLLGDRDRYIIFEKLQRDKFIEVKKMKANETTRLVDWDGWYITFEGILFLKENGYVQQKINIDFENNHRGKMENRMYLSTFWMAFGATGLLLLEILKYTHFLEWLFCY